MAKSPYHTLPYMRKSQRTPPLPPSPVKEGYDRKIGGQPDEEYNRRLRSQIDLHKGRTSSGPIAPMSSKDVEREGIRTRAIRTRTPRSRR